MLVADSGEHTIRVAIFMVGAGLLGFTDQFIIKEKKHYKSGVSEAGYYTGLSFMYFALLGLDIDHPTVYFVAALVVCACATIRYMDLISLIAVIACIVALIFLVFEPIIAILPFIMMCAFLGLFLVSQWLQKRADTMIWEDHFILFDSLALLLIYLGGNYFVVRELSIEMMNVRLEAGQDIPFAFLFYAFTFLIPLAYLGYGIAKKSILFIRVSLLVLTLSVITIKYYYSMGQPAVTVTVAGGLLIVISLVLIRYLKQRRKGYTRDQIFKSKWDNADLAAFIASQSLGGHQINETETNITGQGGEFGGGGASGEF
jgi:hypothetical protein